MVTEDQLCQVVTWYQVGFSVEKLQFCKIFTELTTNWTNNYVESKLVLVPN
jgi:hypothetical protein